MSTVTRTRRAVALLCSLGITLPSLAGIVHAGRPGELADADHRGGDEIVVGGVYVHTGTPVVLWTDLAGMDLTGLSRGTIRRPVAATGPTTTAITTARARRRPRDAHRPRPESCRWTCSARTSTSS